MSKVVEKFIADKFGSQGGAKVTPANLGEPREFARELGNFLYQLHRLPLETAPAPSFENAFAGQDLIFFEAEFTELLTQYQKIVPAELLQEQFTRAAKTKWQKKPVWVLGRFWPENLSVTDGKLTGVKATDQAVNGDPACDLAIAWTLFDEKARKIFFSAADTDTQTIDRARMFALRTALKNYQSQDIDLLIQSRDASTEILKDLNYTIAQDMY